VERTALRNVGGNSPARMQEFRRCQFSVALRYDKSNQERNALPFNAAAAAAATSSN